MVAFLILLAALAAVLAWALTRIEDSGELWVSVDPGRDEPLALQVWWRRRDGSLYLVREWR